MKRLFSARNILILLALATILVFFLAPAKGVLIVVNARTYLWEMLSILPPILILIGLFQIWIPRETVELMMGSKSGLKGILTAIFVGTVAMGPLYAAFPLAVSLLEKGATVFNVAIFLCVWASIKIPMILFEIKFLGPQFAGLRLALTLPSIILISFFLTSLLRRK